MNKIQYTSINTAIIALMIAGLIFSFPGYAEAKTHGSKSVKSALSDASFTNVDALGVTAIQNILVANHSFLKDYSEGGRTAAQIIRDAAWGHGDASGVFGSISITKTVNPAAILATLQKEQSLVTMRTKNDGALNAAMGYGCPDGGGCNEKYKGFTKQVENGAWQLRYSYERAKGRGFKDYQVGQTIKIDGKKVKLTTRNMSALYRYTPHYSSSFTTFFNQYNPATAGAVITTAAIVTSTGATTNNGGINCATIKSKQNRRLCTIAQAKAVVAAPAAAVVVSVGATVNNNYENINCATISSKQIRRICNIAQAKTAAQKK